MFYGTQQEWLTDMEISYTEGPMNLNWKQIMQTVEGDERFYMDTEDDEVTAKEAGWEFLRMNGKDDEVNEESEEESVYSEASNPEEEVSSGLFCLLWSNQSWPHAGFVVQKSEEESEEEDFDDADDDESDFDGDDDLEEQGMDWDDMEKEAAADDHKKKRDGEEVEETRPKKRGSRR